MYNWKLKAHFTSRFSALLCFLFFSSWVSMGMLGHLFAGFLSVG